MIRGLRGKEPKISKSAFISEAAYIVGDVEIGKNTSIWPGVVIRGDFGRIKIGRNCAIEDNCVVHSGTPSAPIGDVEIGDQVVIGHGAVVNCKSIGSNSLIGINAALLHEAEIGENCVVGAGSFVSNGMKIPDLSLVVGVPAKIKGKPTENQLWWSREGYREYVELAKQYMAEGL